MDHLTRSGIWMAFFIILLSIGKMLFRKVRNILILRAIPSPPARPIIGQAIEFIKDSQEEFFRKCHEYAKEYRPIYRLSLFHIDIVNLLNASDIEQVLSNHTHLKKSKAYDALQGWLGTGLLTSTGEKWHSRRKLLTPTFHLKVLQDFLQVFNEETNKLVEKLAENTDENEGIDVTRSIEHFTLQSLGETVMGWDLVDVGLLTEYLQNIKEMGMIIIERLRTFWFRFDSIYSLTEMASKEKRLIQSLHRFSNTVIRRRKIMRRGSTGERNRIALLDLLLKYREEGADIDDDGIREEVDTFLFEGHDTTSVAIRMVLLMLANHEKIQEKVSKELDSIFGGRKRQITQEDLSKMEYLECCIKETLRLYPSVPSIGRICNEEFTTSTGYKIPEGTVMMLHIYDLHRDASVFPNPEKFDPDRFKIGNSSSRHPFAYIPFSAGPRNCIGQKFAMWEMKTVVCGILQNFRLVPIDTPVDIKFYTDLTLRTKSPLRIKFIKK